MHSRVPVGGPGNQILQILGDDYELIQPTAAARDPVAQGQGEGRRDAADDPELGIKAQGQGEGQGWGGGAAGHGGAWISRFAQAYRATRCDRRARAENGGRGGPRRERCRG